MGLFPSNFVEVLGEDFVPKSRETSPMVQAGPSPMMNPTSAPKKEKTVFRKPFQAHKRAVAPSSELARTGTVLPAKSSIPQTPPRDGSVSKNKKSLRTPVTAVKQQSSLSRPDSRSGRLSRSGLSSPAPPSSPWQENEAPQLPPLHMQLSRPQSPAVSSLGLQATDLHRPVPTRQLSRPQSPAVTPQAFEEPDLPPPVPTRRLSRLQSPLVSPHSFQGTDIPPPVPARQVSRPQSPMISPYLHDESQFPPPVPARQLSRPQSPAVSPHASHEPDLPPPVPIRQLSRVQSPAPSRISSPDTEILSPFPNRQFNRSSREPSPLELQEYELHEREESPPPPPPPPHRVAFNRQPSRPPSRQPSRQCSRGMPAPPPLDMNDRYVTMSRTPSPAAPSETNGNTPSPLRDAMEDVMSSLEDMGTSQGANSRSPSPMFSNPWSPDAYDELREPRTPRHTDRPLTSMGLDGNHGPERNGIQPHRNSVSTHDPSISGPPQLNNYVQRMESRLRQLQDQNRRASEALPEDGGPPPPPPKHLTYHGRHNSTPAQYPQLRNRKSGNDLKEDIPNRTFTSKSSTTNSSSGVQSNGTNMTASTDKTSQSLMSGVSAGGFSATSAGSFARRGTIKNGRPNTAMDTFGSRSFGDVSGTSRPETPLTGVSYHSSHNTSRQGASSAVPWSSSGNGESGGVFGGLSTPKTKRHGFFKKIFESAKTGAANARSSIAISQNGGSYSPTKGRPVSPIRPSYPSRDTDREASANTSAMDWVQVRRDVNRSSSPSRNERIERAERCQMMDHEVIYAVEELRETAEGDESIDGLPISEPTNFNAFNLGLVDKSARFVNSLPPMTNPTSLAQGYVCRPYKSDVQRLRAIFTWVSEKIAWDDPVEEIEIDMRRILQTRRASPKEVAFLVEEMCAAVGLHAEAIKGFLKSPGEVVEVDSVFRPNHWWNAVLVDGEWRFMDCSLANPTNPQRSQYVTSNSPAAEGWYFLTRPLEMCYTHIPLSPEEQHICPPVSPDVLLALPTTCPPFFKLNLQLPDYDTSLFRIDGLEVVQIRFLVPPDVECAAEVEAPGFARDADGDYFENGDVVRKRALVQPDWVYGHKRITVKAVLPGDEGQGMVKVYAGPKGLMHSSRDIPHPLAFALPIIHTGENPPYEFVLRHPTPHAQRNDLYIMQPQCAKLAVNNTFVFAVRQHPSTPSFSVDESNNGGRASPTGISRPASALSMVSSSAGGSSISAVSNEFSASTSAISSTRSGATREKPAKLAIQSPSGKILRLTRKADHMMGTGTSSDSITDAAVDGSVWETVIKIGERGVWRGLVLADRVARWCVFCEWQCD